MFATGMLGGNPSGCPADNVLHVYHQERVGQVRAASWFAPVVLKLKDYDEYDDAQLMKQKIAACLAVLTSDVDGSAAALGTADTSTDPQIDSLEPGIDHERRAWAVCRPSSSRRASRAIATTPRSRCARSRRGSA
jgi:capsid protein